VLPCKVLTEHGATVAFSWRSPSSPQYPDSQSIAPGTAWLATRLFQLSDCEPPTSSDSREKDETARSAADCPAKPKAGQPTFEMQPLSGKMIKTRYEW